MTRRDASSGSSGHATLSPRRWDGVLLATLAAAFVLRVWGLDYGLPDVYNPDEVAILSRSLSLADKGLNPGNFVYPSLYFYILAAAVGGWYVLMRATGQVSSVQMFQDAFWQDPTSLYLVGRSLSVAAGVACVAATYAIGHRLGGRTVARVAAVLIAVAYFPVRDAHMIKHDVIATLLFALVVLASKRAADTGSVRRFALAGAIGGASLAFHFYAVVAVVPIVVAAVQRARSAAAVFRTAHVWTAGLAFALAFAALSPFVLLDWTTAARDIAGNREIIVDRARAEFGAIGAGLEQVRLMATEGAGFAMTIAAAVGAALIALRHRGHAAWLLAFPVAFLLFLTQTWPFGRLQNALYPFIAVAAAHLVQTVSAGRRRPVLVTAGLTAILAAQPLWHSILIDRLFTREDTRTTAKRWIAANVPDGAVVAVQPYSVPLETDRQWLAETIERQAPGTPPGARARGQLSRNPYPTPAYRLIVLGEGGLDRDKRFLPPRRVLEAQGLAALDAHGITHVVLKREDPERPDALRDRIARDSTLLFRAWPYTTAEASVPPIQPDHDGRPTPASLQPGPIIEVWRLPPPRHDR